jgi:hypothetical protein
MRLAPLLCCAGFCLAFNTASPPSSGAAPRANKAAAKRKAKPAAKKVDAAEDTEAADTKAPTEPTTEAPADTEAERAVKDKKAPGDGTPRAVETQEKEGVKGYKFGAVEVEGRLKSPQVLYFLRRVRAEFAAGDLGHRSFMRELSHTRHDAAFR